jgi:hypothetical protein
MPRLTDDQLEKMPTVGTSSYGFSSVKPTALSASEYTLVVLAADTSSSVTPFGAEIEKAVASSVAACRKSPRADNLLLRYVTFATNMTEQHGFKPLPECAPNDYVGTVRPGGTTALNDTVLNAVESIASYGKTLTDNDFATNGIIIVVTDGEDVGSRATRLGCKQAIDAMRRSEALESVQLILVGVNLSFGTQSYLQSFKNEIGFDQFVPLQDADAATLAKLANFISKSISSQSQALGSGGPSQALSF